MSNSYDKQYRDEESLFGAPYPELVAFVREHMPSAGGRALDLGCGQGRDALLLAQNGYTTTAVDCSAVGIQQMLDRAEAQGLAVTGVVADLFAYPFEADGPFAAIVLDSILHFEKQDKARELALLDRLAGQLTVGGYFFIFVHKSSRKEKVLCNWRAAVTTPLTLVQDGYIDYVYHEKRTGFRSAFQMYMCILQRTAAS